MIEFLQRTPIELLQDIWIENPFLYMLPEAWIPVTKFVIPNVVEGKYLVSTYGRVVNIKRKQLLPQYITNCGYLRCNLARELEIGIRTRAFSVHRLVMMSFWPIANMQSMQVNHKDEVKTHNWVWNLEWMTPSENILYSMNTGLINIYGENSHTAVLTDEEADKIGYLLSTTNLTAKEISDIIGSHCTESNVYNILNGSSRINIYNKYELYRINRNARVLNQDQIHSVCQAFQDYKNSGKLIGNKFGGKQRFMDYIASICGLPINDSIRRTLSRIYNRTTHLSISRNYDF